ncbi:hypothetical protein IFM89_020657 [Coptis chinensis]|uniref:Uncharacterized protein n=1 Tax=Coptis chinensis TaxID=261450 RepID=A0A835MD31_9MAGN|nr:hypothetical protein IFM89_020657 [Coptis chinensis]
MVFDILKSLVCPPELSVYLFASYTLRAMKNNALHLLVLSHSFSVPSFKRVCTNILEQTWLTTENVIDVLQLHDQMEALLHICKDGRRTIGPRDKVLKGFDCAGFCLLSTKLDSTDSAIPFERK